MAKLGKAGEVMLEMINAVRKVAGKGARAAKFIYNKPIDFAITLASASKKYKNSTILGHAWQKHLDRAKINAWGKLKGNSDTWHDQALKHYNDIINGPGYFYKVYTEKGHAFIEKRLSDGRGIRLDRDFTFKGFIE